MENKEVIIEETRPFANESEDVTAETGKRSGWGKVSVTRRFLVIALAVTVIINGAMSAGVLALSNRSPKEAKPEKNVTEDQSGNALGDQYNDGYGNQYNDPYGSFGDQYSNGYGDQYNNGYGNGYSDPYGSFGDQYSNGYGDQYNNGYGNGYSDPYGSYGDQYSNGNGNQYNDNYGYWSEDGSENGQNNGNSRNSAVSIGIVISENSGVYVAQVTGNNAKKAGFKEGDRIVSIDGKNVGSSSDLISEVQSHKAGDTVSVVVERDGQSIEINTTLE